jgi:hypothetical protein
MSVNDDHSTDFLAPILLSALLQSQRLNKRRRTPRARNSYFSLRGLRVLSGLKNLYLFLALLLSGRTPYEEESKYLSQKSKSPARAQPDIPSIIS